MAKISAISDQQQRSQFLPQYNNFYAKPQHIIHSSSIAKNVYCFNSTSFSLNIDPLTLFHVEHKNKKSRGSTFHWSLPHSFKSLLIQPLVEREVVYVPLKITIFNCQYKKPGWKLLAEKVVNTHHMSFFFTREATNIDWATYLV